MAEADLVPTDHGGLPEVQFVVFLPVHLEANVVGALMDEEDLFATLQLINDHFVLGVDSVL